jgi:hypothetical protein
MAANPDSRNSGTRMTRAACHTSRQRCRMPNPEPLQTSAYRLVISELNHPKVARTLLQTQTSDSTHIRHARSLPYITRALQHAHS